MVKKTSTTKVHPAIIEKITLPNSIEHYSFSPLFQSSVFSKFNIFISWNTLLRVYKEVDNSWLKNKGYIHVTPQLNVHKRAFELTRKIANPKFVEKYAFFPLLHSTIKERRYKKIDKSNTSLTEGSAKNTDECILRAHSYKKNGETVTTAKSRPLHYACHMDSLIYAYYAKVLLEKYEERIITNSELSKAVIAYRKIPLDNKDKNKSTAHFAREVFKQIRSRSNPDCSVLKYDIKSFFNRMNHKFLLNAWMDILGVKRLPKDHFNVYKACTRFSYILKDDFRVKTATKRGVKPGFDEKNLARIRNKHGLNSFFSSTKEFRDAIKNGKIKIHRFPFRDKETNNPVGVPQGLPISSVLANLYLMSFDKAVIKRVVCDSGGFYRRYSDDIIVICNTAEASAIDEFITSKIIDSKVEMSLDKKEEFVFKKLLRGKRELLCSILRRNGKEFVGHPLTYLGFEYYGHKTLIKSTNLAKFYRRMITTVKRKAKRAFLESQIDPTRKPAIYFNQLYKLFTQQNLNKQSIKKNIKYIVPNSRGEYTLKVIKTEPHYRNNYLKYIDRVSAIMGQKGIKRQLRNHKKILHRAINKHLLSKL